ncbi:MAG: hypothetical protein GF331_06080 [Chitinivibrionales bacterium]|nr:hypothetical protein [Chitinivibrionales bacterium]
MACKRIALALSVAVLGGGIALALAADDANGTKAGANDTAAVQTSVRAGAAGKVNVRASGDETIAPQKSGGKAAAKAAAHEAGDSRQTKAVGQTSDFTDDGPRKK